MSKETVASKEIVASKETAGSKETVGLHRKLEKEETVVGDRRKIKKDVPLEIAGPRRDKKKIEVEKAKEKDLEIKIAAPHNAIEVAERKKRRRRSEESSWRGFFTLVVATVVMVLVTLAAFFLLERYQPAGDPLLAEEPFSAGFPGWTEKGDVTLDPDQPGKVTLRNDDPESRSFLRRNIELPSGYTLAFLKATVSTETVIAGDDLWQRARIYFVRLDEDDKPDWNYPHNLFRLRGTNPTETISQVFPVPSSVNQAVLSLEMNNATGEMTISDLELYPVEEQPGFRRVAIALMIAWAILGLFAASAIFNSIRSSHVRLALGGMIGIFALGLFMPAPVRDALITMLHIPSGGEGGIEPDMIGHGVVFAIMAFLVRLGRPDDPIWLHLGSWTLIAIASETLQLFTFDREPSLVDFLVDGIGFALGLTLAIFLPRFYKQSALEA
ncbi:MAG: hypothetical protein ACR2QH_15445 [Geminicoccaceae bacterium]